MQVFKFGGASVNSLERIKNVGQILRKYPGEKLLVVTPEWQGHGISKMLIEKCLDAAKQAGAERVTLFSNSQLQTAIHLYEKYGFRHVEVTDAPYETADVKMELILK